MSKVVSRVSAILLLCSNIAFAAERPQVDEDGTIHIPAFKLPESSFLSLETREELKKQRDYWAKTTSESTVCPQNKDVSIEEMPAVRRCRAAKFYKTPMYKSMREQYAVDIAPLLIGGVYTETFTPVSGVSKKNRSRVLINLHSGAYMAGSRTASQMESIPIAALARIKVISIDYSLGPEHIYPAANNDVLAVYTELLKQYRPESIGIYGSSGGGMLVAQFIALLQAESVPLPAAAGLFFSGAPTAANKSNYKWTTSESGYLTEPLLGVNWESLFGPPHSYFKGISRGSRLDSPGSYDDIMAKFPPTLLLNGGARDFSLSMVIVTHAQLVRLGVEADLHLWEAMGHVFNANPNLPESRESYNVIVKFFDRHLEG
ncbi:alpha/beta hydrolase [Porticoccaceae bacterium]|nr:alpha/beta hydrolase [Porticoccaceae bacterium]